MVSIIIPYNKDRGFLKDAVKSCENQTFDDYEILLQWGDKSTSENINDGIERAKGEYIKLCGEDDILLPNCLMDLYHSIQGADVAAGHCINFREDDSFIRYVKVPYDVYDLAKKNTLHGLGTLYRTSALWDVGLFDEDLDRMEEFELHLCLLANGYRFNLCDKVVAKYRLHTDQKSHFFNNYPDENTIENRIRRRDRNKIIQRWT